ncbi:MAG: dTDP-4-dehydrorhamnose reductase [Verrucomicrobia bacterium]|nr:dTDP-4-dehydrorhamnose reductase [Verrucomicrobiota bacterium]
MLGRAMQAVVPFGVDLRAFSRAELDIVDELGVRPALGSHPDWVINCAAWARVDDAEDHEAEATRINGDAVGLLGKAARDAGSRVMHFSTDYVFDGTLDRPYRETDVPNPQGAYGRGKLAGECALAASECRWNVIRTQWLYGGGHSFARIMWNRARKGLPSRVIDDQWGAPTHVAELATVAWRLVQENANGTWHAAAVGEASWFDVGQKVYEAVGADPTPLSRCSTAEYGSKAPRPANGRLDTSKTGGPRAWDEVLVESVQPDRCGEAGP